MPGPESKEFDRVRQVVAARIMDLRLARGMSEEKLADQAGVDRTYVGMLERHAGNPSLLVLVKISIALGIPLRELL